MKALINCIAFTLLLCLCPAHTLIANAPVSDIAPPNTVKIDPEASDSVIPKWQNLWENARKLTLEDKTEQAYHVYTQLLKEKPNLIEARWEFAQLLIDLGRWKESVPVIETIIEFEPNNIKYLALAGKVALLNKHYNKTVRYYGQVYESDPVGKFSREAVMGLVNGFLGLGNKESAYVVLEQLYLRTNSFEFLSDLARLSSELGYTDKAIAYWIRLSDINPQDKDVIEKISSLYEAQGETGKASEYWKRYLTLDGSSDKHHQKLIDYYVAEGQEGDALPHLIHVYDLRGQPPSVALQIGRIYQDLLDRPDKALLYFERYSREYPFHNDSRKEIEKIRETLASQYLPIIENDGAMILWKDLDHITLNKESLFLKMAEQLGKQSKVTLQTALLEILMQQRPADLDLAYRLSTLYKAQGKHYQAYEILQILDKKRFDNKQYLSDKADIELTFIDEKKGFTSLQRYYRYSNQDRNVYRQLIQLAGNLGIIDELKRIWKHKPKDIKTLSDKITLNLLYIEALRKNGLYAEVDQIYSHIFSLRTLNKEQLSEVHFHLSETLLKRGLFFEAEQIVRQTLAKNLSVEQSLEKLTEIAILEGQYDRARSWLDLLAKRQGIEDFTASSQELPDNLVLPYAEIMLGEGEYEDVVDLIQKQRNHNTIANNNESKVQDNVLIARAYFLNGDRKQATRTLTEISNDMGTAPEVYVLNTLITPKNTFLSSGKNSITRTTFSQHLLRGKRYLDYERPEMALQQINASLKLIPESVHARLLKIKTLTLLSRYDEAYEIVNELSGVIGKNDYLTRVKLELDFKRGNFKEVVKSVAGDEQIVESETTTPAQIAIDTSSWKKLLLARALWAQDRQDEALKVYDSLLAAPLDTMFLEKMELEKINFHLPPLKKSFWNVITFTNPAPKDPIKTVMDPTFVAQNIGKPIDDLAASMYGKYRWEKLIKKEASARQAAKERDYYRAEKEYRDLIKEEKSEETLFDLAAIYNKLGYYGKEAELYEIMKKKGPLYPGLDEYIEANILKRQPRIAGTFINSRRKGRDGYVNMKKRSWGIEGWFMPSYDQEINVELYRNTYKSFDRKQKTESNRLMLTYSTYFEDIFDLNIGIGTDNPNDSGTTEILYKFEMRSRLTDSIEAYGRFEQDLVEDTIQSVTDSIVYRDLEAGFKFDLIPRWFIGADYRYRMYSDDNDQNRYKLWSMYHLFGEMNQFKVKYSYESIRNNSENIGRGDDNFRNFFSSDDRPYWSPNNYWQHLFAIHYKHIFEISNQPEDPLSFFTFDYSYGYEEDHSQLYGFDLNIFLEMDRHFLLKGSLSNSNGDDYEETYAVFSLIYRW